MRCVSDKFNSSAHPGYFAPAFSSKTLRNLAAEKSQKTPIFCLMFTVFSHRAGIRYSKRTDMSTKTVAICGLLAGALAVPSGQGTDAVVLKIQVDQVAAHVSPM